MFSKLESRRPSATGEDRTIGGLLSRFSFFIESRMVGKLHIVTDMKISNFPISRLHKVLYRPLLSH